MNTHQELTVDRHKLALLKLNEQTEGVPIVLINGQKLDMQAMRYFFREFPDVDITPLLAQIQAPALIITGDKDAIVSPTQASHIAQHIPHSELVIIKNDGHMLYMDQPDEYKRVLRTWLSRPSPALSPR